MTAKSVHIAHYDNGKFVGYVKLSIAETDERGNPTSWLIDYSNIGHEVDFADDPEVFQAVQELIE